MSSHRALAGRVVAVTGGANGIGREIATQLAAAGARVAIGDLDREAVRSTADELDGTVMGVELDVTSEESFTRFLAAVTAAWGDLDVLVSNAGVMWVGSFEDEPDAVAQRQVEVNLLGVIRGVRLAAPAMVSRGSGQIITIASAASLLATPGEATYAATKHGVLGYLKAVRAELHRSGVDLSVIMPSVVDTELAVGTSTGAAKLLQPADVARAVLHAIRRPRFEITVPGYIDPVNRIVNLLPRTLRDAVMRRLVPNQVSQADQEARAGYENRFANET